MPIIIPKDLPAFDILSNENIFVMSKMRAIEQDIRPLEIAIVNLMPTKIETETQLMRLLGNSPLQINITLLRTESYKSKNTSEMHLDKFYTTFSEIKNKKFDGMIITGAPVETMPFEEVEYWSELKDIMDYAEKNVTSTMHICWGAQAGLYHYYGIDKYELPKKAFGIFPNTSKVKYDLLLKGMDDVINIPHSRHTSIDLDGVRNCPELIVLAESDEVGVSIIKSRDDRKIFLTGHSEYGRETLKNEYMRDFNKGLDIDKPKHYFVNDDLEVNMNWSTTANLLFYNWLNYYVYQVTPFTI